MCVKVSSISWHRVRATRTRTVVMTGMVTLTVVIAVKSESRSAVFDSLETPWTVARKAPPSMGFPRQEYWSGLLFPSLGDLPDRGMEPMDHGSPAMAGGFFTI